MKSFRFFASILGALVFFVSLINVWMTWMKGADTSFHWMLVVIGAFMWVQGIGITFANRKK